ncbi:uncharacterized protein [Ptychodera flava]|uniref:uncharacterized protein n=1 Tax=Ptychodera flava TaxID=63121 RepID=UPI00396A0D36
MISTYTIMSISSAVIFATMLFVISVVAATREYRCFYCSSPKGRLAVDVLLAVVAVAEAAVAIVASAICCRAVCCKKNQHVLYGFLRTRPNTSNRSSHGRKSHDDQSLCIVLKYPVQCQTDKLCSTAVDCFKTRSGRLCASHHRWSKYLPIYSWNDRNILGNSRHRYQM